MKQKTAVQWLVEQMFGEHTRAWQKQIDQAIAMEKEQKSKLPIHCYAPNVIVYIEDGIIYVKPRDKSQEYNAYNSIVGFNPETNNTDAP